MPPARGPLADLTTAPNLLTLSRIAALPPICALVVSGKDLPAAVLFALAAATDLFDGAIARRYRLGTGLGRILDPSSDRLLVTGVALALAARGLLPWWVAVILVGRDLVAIVGVVALEGKIEVNAAGKTATAVLMVSVILVVAGAGKVGEVLIYTGVALSLLSGLSYARRILS
jgi:CDP-diacylglycerol--glycerol-3-phosphate 3-phosphatidyltransferase